MILNRVIDKTIEELLEENIVSRFVSKDKVYELEEKLMII
jgi:hypothetical protein